jgi:hypothetical protein
MEPRDATPLPNIIINTSTIHIQMVYGIILNKGGNVQAMHGNNH